MKPNSDIVSLIARTTKLPKRRLASALTLYRKILKRELLSTGSVRLPKLGTISVRKMRRKVGNNKRSTSFKTASFRLSAGMK